MSSSSLAPKYSEANVTTFALVSENAAGAKWLVASRPLANPQSIEVIRKIGNQNSNANDHVILRSVRSETNATTGKVATAVVSVDISIPRDTATVTQLMINRMIGELVSLLNGFSSTELETSRSEIISLLSGGTL